MKWTRREWMLAIGAVPLELAAIKALSAQGRGGGRGSAAQLPPLGAPPSLPDKASFQHVRPTYLNAAASHSRPAGGLEMVKRALAAEAGEGAADAFHPNQNRIRDTFAKMINAEPQEVTFVPSTQIGESFVAAALGVHERGSHVVSDYLHFVGSQMMYTDMAKRGVDVTWVKIKDGRIPIEDIDRAIRKGKTKLVAISATAFVNGFQHDVKRVCELAHAKGAMVYVDMIQAAGNTPIDVKDWGVDAACCATYKWLMSSGTAFLYVREASQAKMQNPFYHWTQETTPLPTTHMYMYDTPGPQIVSDYGQKPGAAGMFSMNYEPNTATLAGLEYSLPYLMNIGIANIQAYEQTIVRHLKEELPKKGYPLLTPMDSHSPIVSIAVKDASRLAPTLRAANVTVTTRWNHVRIAPSVFNDIEDANRLVAALPKV